MFTSETKKPVVMPKNNENGNNSVNLIGPGTVIQGDVRSDGDIRIDGSTKGSVTSKGKVVVGTTGVVEGEIQCQNADVSGTVKAKINVKELLSLKPTAKLHGDIVTGKLAIDAGALFSGTCRMGSELTSSAPAQTEKIGVANPAQLKNNGTPERTTKPTGQVLA